MSQLLAGFSRVNIDPPLGIPIAGYYETRLAEGYLDALELNCLALASGETRAVMLSFDLCGIDRILTGKLAAAIMQATGLPKHAVFIHSTHTHTGPCVPGYYDVQAKREAVAAEYFAFLTARAADAAKLALQDLKPARMGYGIGQAPGIAFIRRFRMKDGTVKTNPGVDNPDIVAPIGQVDERVNVVRFDRENDSLVLVNVGNHPDVVGGNLISADWPGFLRRTVEKTLDNTRCIFFNGAQGDVNHVNVHPRGGFLNDMFMDFDDVSRGYGHARYMGRVVAGGVLQAFDKVQYTDDTQVKINQHIIHLPANRPDPQQLPEAHRINNLHIAGRDSELPYEGMMLTTVLAEAERMVLLENGPDFFDMELSAIAVGPIVFIGIPGEPFNGIGLGLKDAPGWSLVCPCCLTNGSEGYFPMMDAYDEGGYEARSSPLKAGCAELIVNEGLALLDRLHTAG